MNYELSKIEKKIARKVIETGLQRDYERSILDIDKIIRRWNNQELNNRDGYMELYRKVIQNDKYIARMYNDIRGSTYLTIIGGLLARKVIFETDLSEFGEETRNNLLGIGSLLGGEE
jgi:hypothetical protein